MPEYYEDSAPAEPVVKTRLIDWKAIAMNWLVHQSITTVLLILFIGTTMAGCWFLAERAIPSHIEMIQKGYDRHVEAHAKEVEKLETTFEKTVDKFVQLIEKREADDQRRRAEQ